MPGPLQAFSYEAPPGQWLFSSAAPDPGLADVVVEYWEVEGRLAPFRERVLPNGCTELMFNLGPPHQLITEAGTSTWDRAWFSGLHERAISIESLHGTHLVSARLRPLGSFLLLGPVAPASVNRVVELEGVLGAAGRTLRESLVEAPSAERRFALLEDCLLPRRAAGTAPSPIVVAATSRIEASHGMLRIGSLTEDLGVSRKRLWALFGRELGLSPKAYAGLQRFVWTLERLRESTEVDWPGLAAAAGYSDQAHLVRDFRRVAHASPTEFLRIRTPDTTALLDEAR